MVTRVLGPKLATRARARSTPSQPPPGASLRVFSTRHHLTPVQPAIRPPAGAPPARRRQIRPVDLAPAPVLRKVAPRPVPIPRFRVTHAAAPEPAYLPPPAYGPATSVGIVAAGGTRIIGMVPADLTLQGRVDITDFRITLFAGVW